MAFQTQYDITNKSSSFPLRRVVFAYQDAAGKEQYLEDIDVQFQINLAGNTILPNAVISVCNIDTNSMKYLTTITPLDNNHKVALYVGYEDNISGSKTSVLPRIYTGDIRQSYFTNPPDIWLQMSTIDQNVQLTSSELAQMDSEATCVRDYIIDIAKNCGYAVNINDDDFGEKYRNEFPDFFESVLAEDYHTNYTPWKIREKTPLATLKSLQKAYNLTITMLGGRCFVYPNSRYIQQKEERSNADFIISQDTGMIGIPTVSNTTAEIITLFNAAILPSSTVELKSERLSDVYVDRTRGIAANGIYTVVKIEHTGHLRGNEFYTRILAIRGNY